MYEESEVVKKAKELTEEATPGPWEWAVDDGEYHGCGEVFTLGEGVEGGSIAGPTGDCYPRGGYDPKADMEFIAWARQGVLDLIEEIEHLQEILNDYDESD